MKCLIIAAGRGSRLSHKGDCKPLIEVGGTALINRVISTANRVGIINFLVVTGYNTEKIRSYLEGISLGKKIEIHFVHNNEWKKENGLSVLKAKDYINEKFILLMADHIFDPKILLKLKNQTIHENEIILAVDFNTNNNHYVDLEDVTKVQVENGLIVNIGKNIKKFNAFDTGIFLCTPTIFQALHKSSSNGDSTLSGGIRVLAANNKVRSMDIDGKFWIDVDDEKTLQKANCIIKSLDNDKSNS